MRKVILFVLLSFLFSGCAGIISEEIIHLQINHYKELHVDGESSSQMFHLLGKTDSETNWSWQSYIYNFDYEWGYTYSVTVNKTVYDHHPDFHEWSPYTRYELISIDSKNKVASNTTFTLELLQSSGWNYTTVIGNRIDGYSFAGVSISCESNYICDYLDSITNVNSHPGYSLFFDFVHTFSNNVVKAVGVTQI